MLYITLLFGLVLGNPEGCVGLAGRTRKEWRELTATEQQAYLSAVQCLRTKPSRLNPLKKRMMGGVNAPVTRWDDFTWYGHLSYSRVHQQEISNVHNTPMFLPWHRVLLTLQGKALKNSCGYKGALPYWDWSVDASRVTKSSIWDSTLGFGRNQCFSSKKSIITLSSQYMGHTIGCCPYETPSM